MNDKIGMHEAGRSLTYTHREARPQESVHRFGLTELKSCCMNAFPAGMATSSSLVSAISLPPER